MIAAGVGAIKLELPGTVVEGGSMIPRYAFVAAVGILFGGDSPLIPLPPGADEPGHEWRVVSCAVDGTPVPEAVGCRLTIRRDTFTPDPSGSARRGHYRVDRSREPMQIDVWYEDGPDAGRVIRGIWKGEGDTMTDCFAAPGDERPTAFDSRPGSGRELIVYRRTGR
jgi:uncharacterized protein (TIGR03067 family)